MALCKKYTIIWCNHYTYAMKPAFSYSHPHPAVTTDVVVFAIRDQHLHLLLIRRGRKPFKDRWALPGGFLEISEDLESCARRELAEETGIQDLYLEQLYTFGAPERDPRERVISVTYLGLGAFSRLQPRAADDAAEAAWHPFGRLPELAFDHRQIVNLAHERLVAKLSYSTIAFQFLEQHFTLSELQSVFEILRNEPLDKRNFRKWILSLDRIVETGETRRNGNHRPARVYRARYPRQVEIIR